MEDITIIIANHKTYSMLKRCVESLLFCYPTIEIIIIDNGSLDVSSQYAIEIAKNNERIETIIYDKNLGHGPAMDIGIRTAKADYIFALDTDSIVLRGGFLEKMRDLFIANDNLYAVGWLIYVTERGASADPWDIEQIPYVHPSAMMLSRQKYLELKPMIWHGAPCIENMADARDRGYRVFGFPIDGYVLHLGRGTRNMIGTGWHGMKGEG